MSKRFERVIAAVRVMAEYKGTKKVAGVDTGIALYDIYKTQF